MLSVWAFTWYDSINFMSGWVAWMSIRVFTLKTVLSQSLLYRVNGPLMVFFFFKVDIFFEIIYEIRPITFVITKYNREEIALQWKIFSGML